MILFSLSELLVLLKTEQLFKMGSISYLPSALCSRVQSEFPSSKSYTLICVYSGGWEGEREQRRVTLITSLKLIQRTLFYCGLLYCASQITVGVCFCVFLQTENLAQPYKFKSSPLASHNSLLTALPVFTLHSSSLFFTLQPNWYFQDIINFHYLLLKILWIAFHFT